MSTKVATVVTPLDRARDSYQTHASAAAADVKKIRDIASKCATGAPSSAQRDDIRDALKDLAKQQKYVSADLNDIHAAGGDPGEIAHDARYMSELNNLAQSSTRGAHLDTNDVISQALQMADTANSANAALANNIEPSNADTQPQGATEDAHRLSDPNG